VSITYTFPADCAKVELRGVTAIGGVLCRVDGKAGEPDAVRFTTTINGARLYALIAGKPELEAVLAAKRAKDEKRATTLATIGWEAFEKAQDAREHAQEAYDIARDRGYPVKEAAALKKAEDLLQQMRTEYPSAALYSRARAYSYAANYSKAAIGTRAVEAIEQGADVAATIAAMDAEWSEEAARLVDRM
jgi:hypothetical protein